MGTNLYVTSSIENLNIEYIDINVDADQSLDIVRVLFEYLFTTSQSLKSQNKYFLLYLQHHISEKNFEIINRVFTDGAMSDLNISLLKSAIIITENIVEVDESRQKISTIFEQKLHS